MLFYKDVKMIKFIKSFFAKKTPPVAPVVEQPKVEQTVAPVVTPEPVVAPEVSNPIIQTTVVTAEETKEVVVETAKPAKKQTKPRKPRKSK
jgi:hypothetical protein